MATPTTLTSDTPRGVLVKTTAVDYPGRIAAAFFLSGCNLRCPYCQNAALVTGGEGRTPPSLCSIDELFTHLEKRRGVISALVLSGGEPLVTPAASEILSRAKSMGLRVKLDTNGTLPDALERIVQDDRTRPDFIAMDIKTAPARYGELCGDKNADYKSLLEHSISIISAYPRDCREWRTVLVPPLVGESDIGIMAAMLPRDASWQFAQFRPGGCISSDYDTLLPMTDGEAAALVARARRVIPGSVLR